MPEAPTATPDALPVGDALVGGILFSWLIAAVVAAIRSGAISRRAFVTAPVRPGTMGLHDVLVTGGLFVLGPVILGAYFGVEPGAASPRRMLQMMLLSQLAMIPAVSYILWRADTALPEGVAGLGLRPRQFFIAVPRSIKTLLVVYPIANAAAAVTVMILWSLGHELPVVAHEALEQMVQMEAGTPTWWGLTVSAVVLAPVLEETIFRGLVQTSLLQSGIVRNRWTAIALAAVPFAFIHSAVAPPHALPGLYALAVGLGWAYERWGSLWIPILMHALWNAANIAIATLVFSQAH